MNEYFTVDRNKSLTPGQILNIDTYIDNRKFWPIQNIVDKNDLANLVNELYPNGLTEHGKRYLLDECLVIPTSNGPAPSVPHMPMIELIFELVRRLEFPNQISRFQVIYGWDSVEDAKKFKLLHGTNDSSIYAVTCEESVRLDMNLLYLGGSSIGSIFFARKYWRGEAGNNPQWEILMKPPVEVVRIIE